MTVATTLREVAPDRLDGLLRSAGHSGAEVVAVRAEELTFTGATTDMARLHLDYGVGTGGPATLIAKTRGASEVQRQMDVALGLFDREVRFYRELAARVPVRTPACLHAGDPLLLEDLGALRAGDQSQGLLLADAEASVDALADMHAAFWESRELAGDWLTRPHQGMFAGMLQQLVLSGAEQLTSRFAGRGWDAELAAMTDAAARWTDVLGQLAEGPHTLVHNDCRLDNMFFAEDGTPVFVDWQMPADFRGSLDLGNLLGGGLEPEVHAAHWRDLIGRYHERLVGAGVSDYSLEQCTVHYRQSLPWALSQGMALLGALSTNDHRGVGDRICVRALSHIADVGSFDALSGH